MSMYFLTMTSVKYELVKNAPYKWSKNNCVMMWIGLVQDCSNSFADALELLQSCTKPSISFLKNHN